MIHVFALSVRAAELASKRERISAAFAETELFLASGKVWVEPGSFWFSTLESADIVRIRAEVR